MFLNNDQGIKLSGFFKGKVVKHCDFGKCKIWIPGIYPDDLEEKPEKLPDAIQVAPMFGGSFKGNGVFSYPNIGSIVVCGFLNEDQNQPIYWGALQGGEDAKAQYTEARNETSEEAIKTDDDARVHKITVDKSTIKIWESGHIEIKTFKDRKYNTGKEIPEVGCQIDIDENGTVNIEASTQIHIKSPDVMVDTGKFTLNCQTAKIKAGQEIGLYSDKYMVIHPNDQLDITAKTEIHMNEANYVQALGQIGLNAAYVGIQGKTHPPIFL